MSSVPRLPLSTSPTYASPATPKQTANTICTSVSSYYDIPFSAPPYTTWRKTTNACIGDWGLKQIESIPKRVHLILLLFLFRVRLVCLPVPLFKTTLTHLDGLLFSTFNVNDKRLLSPDFDSRGATPSEESQIELAEEIIVRSFLQRRMQATCDVICQTILIWSIQQGQQLILVLVYLLSEINFQRILPLWHEGGNSIQSDNCYRLCEKIHRKRCMIFIWHTLMAVAIVSLPTQFKCWSWEERIGPCVESFREWCRNRASCYQRLRQGEVPSILRMHMLLLRRLRVSTSRAGHRYCSLKVESSHIIQDAEQKHFIVLFLNVNLFNIFRMSNQRRTFVLFLLMLWGFVFRLFSPFSFPFLFHKPTHRESSQLVEWDVFNSL